MSDTPQPDPNAGRNAPNDPDAVRREEIARQEEADRLQSGQPVEREVPALNEQQRQEQDRAAQERGQNNPENTGDQAAQEREGQGQDMPDGSAIGDRRGEDAGDGGGQGAGQTPDEELPGDGGTDRGDGGTTTTTTTTTEGGGQQQGGNQNR